MNASELLNVKVQPNIGRIPALTGRIMAIQLDGAFRSVPGQKRNFYRSGGNQLFQAGVKKMLPIIWNLSSVMMINGFILFQTEDTDTVTWELKRTEQLAPYGYDLWGS
ncbi:MAG: hypothetical protein R3B47_16170 [Bacteroidia bacterium]